MRHNKGYGTIQHIDPYCGGLCMYVCTAQAVEGSLIMSRRTLFFKKYTRVTFSLGSG